MEWLSKEERDKLNKGEYDSLKFNEENLYNSLKDKYETQIRVLQKRIESLEGFFRSSEEKIVSSLEIYKLRMEDQKRDFDCSISEYRDMIKELYNIFEKIDPDTLKNIQDVAKIFDSIKGCDY